MDEEDFGAISPEDYLDGFTSVEDDFPDDDFDDDDDFPEFADSGY